MTEKEWEVYINHSDYSIKVDIAEHKDTPVWVLERLISLKDAWICWNILRNPNVTSEILDKMMDAVISQDPEHISYPEGILFHSKCLEETILKWNAFDKFKDHLKNCHTQSPRDSDFGI